MSELNDDATDGQLADYLAAGLSGDLGAWNIGIIEYRCPRCGRTIQIQNDAIKSFDSLIIGWHRKADGGDYFARFVFEYLAFIAHIKNNLYCQESSDRRAIQSLKQDERVRNCHLAKIRSDQELSYAWSRVIEELAEISLKNSSSDPDNPEIDKWWNTSEFHPNTEDSQPKGTVLSVEDWQNMVEFWYAVRNNLFHGGKNPNIHRDLFLVEHAYLTLSSLMESEINHFQSN